MPRHLFAAFLVPALVVAACASPSTPPKAAASAKPAAIAAKPSMKPTSTAPETPTTGKMASLTGTASAPAGLVAAGGGNYVGPNGASIVAAGGGNLVAAGGGNYRASLPSAAFLHHGDRNYALLAIDEKPLAGAAVYLVPADEKHAIPDRDPDAIADAKGAFAIPVGVVSTTGAYAVVVSAENADGKAAPMATVVDANPAGKVAKVGAATTMVTALLRKRGASAFAGFQLAQFDGLVALLAEELDAANLPDFSDPEAVAAKADELGQQLDAFGKALDAWGAGLQKDPGSILGGNLPGGLPGLPGFPLK